MLSFLLITHNDAPWLESTWNRMRQILTPSDSVSLVDGGSQDETPVLLRHLIARHPLPAPMAAPPVFLPQSTAQDPGAWWATATAAITDHRYLVWVGGGDQLVPDTVQNLRTALAVKPVGLLFPQSHWHGEPGVDLGIANSADWGGTVIPFDPGAALPLWPRKMTAASLDQMNTDLRAHGAVVHDAPLSIRPLPLLPAAPATDLPAPAMAKMILDACASPGGSDADWATWTDQCQQTLIGSPAHDPELSVSDKAFLTDLQTGGPTAQIAVLRRRLYHSQRLRQAVEDRMITLRAAYDATVPDAEQLIRAHARMRADAKARDL